MELVSGRPITQYCDERRLPIEARLELFIRVCEAVQHAHQKGIIHRDLKPSNILVSEIDGVASPKVIDFGIAKALAKSLTSRTLVTEAQQLLGTPQYMSPEQADADALKVDTRSDIYSLGVVLYELLTGTTPIDAETLRDASLSRLQRVVSENIAERPSTRISRLAAKRSGAAAGVADHAWRRRLRGDLDWIALRALEHDRERRYSSAAAFAEDIRRHLRHEPVEAGPPGAAYRVRKFVRRHRMGMAAAAAVGLTVIAGLVVVLVATLRVRDSAAEARSINQFMREVLGSVSPNQKGADVRLAEVLHGASASASQRFAGQPNIEVQVRDLLGHLFNSLDMRSESTAEMRKAADLALSTFGPDDRRTLGAQLAYAHALVYQESARPGQAALADLLPRLKRLVAPDDPMMFEAEWLDTACDLMRGDEPGAEAKLRDLKRRVEASGASEALKLSIIDSLLTMLQQRLGDVAVDDLPLADEMESLARDCLARCERLSGPESLQAFRMRAMIADVRRRRGDFAGAVEMSSRMLDDSLQRLGECHIQRQVAMGVLADAELGLGNAAEAADIWLRQIACAESQGRGSLAWLTRVADSLPCLDRGGRWAQGEALARELAARLREIGGGHGDMLLNAEMYVARFVALQGRLDQAQSLLTPLLEQADRPHGVEEPQTRARVHMFYGSMLVQQGRFDEALTQLQQAADLTGGLQHGTWVRLPDDLISEFIGLYQASGQPQKAAELEGARADLLAAYRTPR